MVLSHDFMICDEIVLHFRRNVTHRDGEDGPDEVALVVPSQLGQDALQDGDQFVHEAGTHGVHGLLDEVVDLGVVLVLE